MLTDHQMTVVIKGVIGISIDPEIHFANH